MRIYLSGPMQGLPGDNIQAFRHQAATLRAQGYLIEDPSEHFAGMRGLPRHRYLATDVQVLIEKCRAIALMPGWQYSEGAKLELQIAIDRGYLIYLCTPLGEL